MMNISKKIFATIFALFAISVLPAKTVAEKKVSTFSAVFYGCTFFSPEDVIEAYRGAWNGTQIMSVSGNNIATAIVDQNYVSTGDSTKRLVGSGKITGMGTSIPTRSFIYVENGTLCLDIRTQDGRDVPYVGFITDNKIEWVPKYFFMTYDSQTDTFANSSDGVKMHSHGVKYVKIKESGFEGYIQVDCTFRKSETYYKKEKVNTSKNAKFVFPSAKMGE